MANENIVDRAEEIKTWLVSWRRHLHKYPELSFQEKQTSKFIESVLRSMGILKLETGIGKHGIVATLGNGEAPVIAIRADMDALPIQELNDDEYASTYHGMMHACGHDAHTAILLGTAKLLVEDYEAGNLTGTVKLIFQPAEEDTDEHGITGAPYVLQSGVLDDVDAALALHMCPWRQVGEIQVNDGPSMANIDNFELTITGTGGHGGYPHQGKDPFWMMTYVLQGIYSLISRKMNPLDVGTISVGQIQGGTAMNVIPDQVKIRGTMRSYTDDVREQLKRELEQIAGVVHAFGGDYELQLEQGEPALVNDRKINDVIRQAVGTLFPNMNMYEEPFGMGSEDFGHITKQIPGAMFFLGCGFDDGIMRHLHTPDFKINEDVLPIGTALFTACAHQLLLDGGGK
ncbi:M20 metallopeptidase family protein [Terrihalobacillus insolitus]|uniref:M20 metallopeptidase family protein n=1 Tax=Terrihalobacillus insolitus TaxID=2950438 RepID=UPI0023420933|nr:amidohydrolase [Terrihalobacillus insolitus]MDC3415069.1 amidohydrolase [Terrihalobacillus insolitus]